MLIPKGPSSCQLQFAVRSCGLCLTGLRWGVGSSLVRRPSPDTATAAVSVYGARGSSRFSRLPLSPRKIWP